MCVISQCLCDVLLCVRLFVMFLLVCVVCFVMYVLLCVDVGLLFFLKSVCCYMVVSLSSFLFWCCVLHYNILYVVYFVFLFVMFPCDCVLRVVPFVLFYC